MSETYMRLVEKAKKKLESKESFITHEEIIKKINLIYKLDKPSYEYHKNQIFQLVVQQAMANKRKEELPKMLFQEGDKTIIRTDLLNEQQWMILSCYLEEN